MSGEDGKTTLVENDELEKVTNDESKTENNSENTGLLNGLKNRFGFEINGLFYIILALIILAIALTIGMVLSIFFGPPQIKPHAGISTPIKECSKLGLDICHNGGSAVDAAIGAFLCLSTVSPETSGLGGCGIMVVHNHSSLNSTVIDMSCKSGSNNISEIQDGFNVKESVAIPGILSGLNLAYKTFGKMNWSKIIDMTMKTLSDGVEITPYIKSTLESNEYKNMSQVFKYIYGNAISSGKYKLDDKMKVLFTKLKDEGPSSLISGSVMNEFVAAGINANDISNVAQIQQPIKALFGDFLMVAPPLPSKSSLDMVLTYEIMNKLAPKKSLKKETAEFYHLLLQSIQISQAVTSFLGDNMDEVEKDLIKDATINNLIKLINKQKAQPQTSFAPFYRHKNLGADSGTQISAVDPTSLYVSFSANIGSKFGSGINTASGILLNDAMRLFNKVGDQPVNGTLNWASELNITNIFTKSNNLIGPNKRPMNNLSPVIVYNMKRKCGVRFALGGNSGARSFTGNIQMILTAIYLDQTFCPSKDCLDLKKAGNQARLHIDQLVNKNNNNESLLLYNSKFPTGIIHELKNNFGYNNLQEVNDKLMDLFSIGKVQYEIKGFSDVGSILKF